MRPQQAVLPGPFQAVADSQLLLNRGLVGLGIAACSRCEQQNGGYEADLGGQTQPQLPLPLAGDCFLSVVHFSRRLP